MPPISGLRGSCTDGSDFPRITGHLTAILAGLPPGSPRRARIHGNSCIICPMAISPIMPFSSVFSIQGCCIGDRPDGKESCATPRRQVIGVAQESTRHPSGNRSGGAICEFANGQRCSTIPKQRLNISGQSFKKPSAFVSYPGRY
jgi:hypothetical protein